MDLYCKKLIQENGEVIEKEEKLDDTFDEVVLAKLRKIRTQVLELKIVKKNNTRRYDEIIDEVEDLMTNYKSVGRVKKEWKLYENIFCVDVNYKNKNFKVKKKLPHWGYISNREYYLK